ncbi:MAG: FtsX-like permease family protein [Nitrososphaeraceae archaeon]
MNIKEIFGLSLGAIRERKVRSALTILMVLVGSSLLVAVNAFGAGFSDFFNKQFANLAPNILFVSSVQQDQNDGGGGIGSVAPPPSAKITLNAAVESRIRSLPFVSQVIPSYQGDISIQSGSESKSFSVLSMDPSQLFVISPTLELAEGSTLPAASDPTAILVAQDIAFPPGESTPFINLGQSVRLSYSFVDPDTGEAKEESRSFVVRGLIESTGNPTVDNAVVIGLQPGDDLLQRAGKFDSLFVVASSTAYVDAVEDEIRTLYGNDIGITTVQNILKTIEEFTGGINAFLASIAIISLVVGAVGIITTLYTSVVERIREIGTLKAIGAKNTTILGLFLFEALLIGIIGASFGLIAGIGMGYLLASASPGGGGGGEDGESESGSGTSTAGTNDAANSNGGPSGTGDGSTTEQQTQESEQLTPVYLGEDMIRVWFISVGLSIMAGLYPAWKASRYLPVDALRAL